MSSIIDTHIHFDSKEFNHDVDNVIVESTLCGIKDFIIPAASIETLDSAISIANRHSNVYYASGIHPCCINEIYDIKMQKFYSNAEVIIKNIASSKCKAIGECGLDFFRLENDIDSTISGQISCFEWQIQLALTYNLPLILHVRDHNENYDASLKVLEILKKYQAISKQTYGEASRLRGVFHCYNACEALFELSNFFYYGIGGIVTFKNASKLQSVLTKIPQDRILLETDAPYLAPIPHRGKRNESKFLVHVVAKIAEILHVSQDDVARITTQNAKRLFEL